MPRLNKDQKHLALLEFVADVYPMIKENFNDDEKNDKRLETFTLSGWYYRNFRRIYLSNSMEEILIERINITENEIKPTIKKGQIHQQAFIYKENENKRYHGKYQSKDPGFIYNGYSFQDFVHKII